MDFSDYKNHIEYLGYTTREITENQAITLLAESPVNTKPNFNLTKVGELRFLIIRSNWSITKVPGNIYEIVNLLNEKAVNISSIWYYQTTDNKPAIGISAAYFEPYNKEVFASFLDIFLADIGRVLLREEMKQLQ